MSAGWWWRSGTRQQHNGRRVRAREESTQPREPRPSATSQHPPSYHVLVHWKHGVKLLLSCEMRRRTHLLALAALGLLLASARAHEGHHSDEEESEEDSTPGAVAPRPVAPDPALLTIMANAPHTDVLLGGGKLSLAWLVRGDNITFIVQSLDAKTPVACVPRLVKLRLSVRINTVDAGRARELLQCLTSMFLQGCRLRNRNANAKSISMCAGPIPRDACVFYMRRLGSNSASAPPTDIGWMDGGGKGHVRNYHIAGACVGFQAMAYFATHSLDPNHHLSQILTLPS